MPLVNASHYQCAFGTYTLKFAPVPGAIKQKALKFSAFCWQRRERDSNPRCSFPHSAFRVRPIQPALASLRKVADSRVLCYHLVNIFDQFFLVSDIGCMIHVGPCLKIIRRNFIGIQVLCKIQVPDLFEQVI